MLVRSKNDGGQDSPILRSFTPALLASPLAGLFMLTRAGGTAAVIAMLSISACAKPAPPIAVDSYCVKFQAKDFTDKGLRAQNDMNIRADLTNENTRLRDCAPERSGLKAGPK